MLLTGLVNYRLAAVLVSDSFTQCGVLDPLLFLVPTLLAKRDPSFAFMKHISAQYSKRIRMLVNLIVYAKKTEGRRGRKFVDSYHFNVCLCVFLNGLVLL